jgi:uncharacterized phage-like protein YoqJ
MVSGHRQHKLLLYNPEWIKTAIELTLIELKERGLALAYSGMASGVDLWFCQACLNQDIPYIACIPFDEQGDDYSIEDYELRKNLISSAKEIKKVRNTFMVENCNLAIVCWDGNKGGTHNCFQQLLEAKKDIYWLNPIKEKIIII